MKQIENKRYSVKVTITDPKTPVGMFSALFFDIECEFSCNPKDYGNGYYMYISGKGFSELVYDLRYNTAFDRHNKEGFIKQWANSYWTGENGAWAVKDIAIKAI